jgi:hypothetical protein
MMKDLVTLSVPKISGNYTKSDILEKAKRAIKPTGVKGSVLVTHSNGRTWSNLSKV